METFIYWFGAIVFSVGVAWIVFKIVDFIEKR